MHVLLPKCKFAPKRMQGIIIVFIFVYLPLLIPGLRFSHLVFVMERNVAGIVLSVDQKVLSLSSVCIF